MPDREHLTQIAVGLSIPTIQHHIFLCAEQTKPKCCSLEAGVESWDYLKRLFSFWIMLLLATGIKAAAGMKFAFGSALFAVLLPWGVYVLGKSALAGIF